MFRFPFLIACGLMAARAIPETYLITPLGGGGQSAGMSINCYGQVVFNSWVGGSDSAAYLWDPVTGATYLGVLPGYSSSNGEAVNKHGDVAGNVWQGALPFAWSQKTGMQSLNLLSKASLRNVFDLNDLGQFVGQTDAGLAYIWGQATGLKITAQWGGAALGVNNHSEVVGWWGSLSATPFRWDPVNGQTDLQMPRGATDAWATDINDRGQVVGSASVFQLKGSWVYPCVWEKTGELRLPLGAGSNVYSEGRSINNRGQVVGGNPYGNEAFIWDTVKGTRYLSDLIIAPGWNLSMAQGINDSGQIVGTGTYAGAERAFLATPVPFPGMPIDYQVTVGSELDHDVHRLYEGDDDRVQLRSSGISQMTAMVVEACSPWAVPSRMTFILESSSRSSMRTLRVDIFDPIINDWVNVHNGFQPTRTKPFESISQKTQPAIWIYGLESLR